MIDACPHGVAGSEQAERPVGDVLAVERHAVRLPDQGAVHMPHSEQFTPKTPDPSPTFPWRKRPTVDRAEKGALVVVNSMVLQSSGSHLTLPGTAITTTSRIDAPLLLGLAALAVRARVKS
ncbi:hypothetical protein [Kitasatospora griseola]|uniref:hypothetical protein n=1 Tax=Kitasatospora griseola TaxID=2064 RepID=UPI00342AEFF5